MKTKPLTYLLSLTFLCLFSGSSVVFGDAGMVVTKDKDLANKMKMLANHGRLDKYVHQMAGYNYRFDPLQAAILNVKLNYLDDWLKKRRAHARLYNQLFAEYDAIKTPVERDHNLHVHTYYVIRTSKRDAVMQKLHNHEIDAIIHYPIPLHLQPAFSDLSYRSGDFPIAEQSATEILSLPLYPELEPNQIEYIAEQVLSAI